MTPEEATVKAEWGTALWLRAMKAEAEVARLLSLLSELEMSLAVADRVIDTQTTRIAELEAEVAQLQADASQCCDGYEGQLGMLQVILNDRNQRVSELEAAVGTANQEVARWQHIAEQAWALHDAKGTMNIQRHFEKLEKLEADVGRANQEVVTLGDSLFTAREEIERLKGYNLNAAYRIAELETENARLTAELTNEDWEWLKARAEKAEAAVGSANQEVALLRAVIERLEGEYQDQKAENARLKAFADEVVRLHGVKL